MDFPKRKSAARGFGTALNRLQSTTFGYISTRHGVSTNPFASPSNHRSPNSFSGLWHVVNKDDRKEAFFNVTGQAFAKIENTNLGHFQIGPVTGQIDGKVSRFPASDRFEFSWEGVTETDPIFGTGWIKLVDNQNAEGEIDILQGDKFHFWLSRVDQNHLQQ